MSMNKTKENRKCFGLQTLSNEINQNHLPIYAGKQDFGMFD